MCMTFEGNIDASLLNTVMYVEKMCRSTGAAFERVPDSKRVVPMGTTSQTKECGAKTGPREFVLVECCTFNTAVDRNKSEQ